MQEGKKTSLVYLKIEDTSTKRNECARAHAHTRTNEASAGLERFLAALDTRSYFPLWAGQLGCGLPGHGTQGVGRLPATPLGTEELVQAASETVRELGSPESYQGLLVCIKMPPAVLRTVSSLLSSHSPTGAAHRGLAPFHCAHGVACRVPGHQRCDRRIRCTRTEKQLCEPRIREHVKAQFSEPPAPHTAQFHQ